MDDEYNFFEDFDNLFKKMNGMVILKEEIVKNTDITLMLTKQFGNYYLDAVDKYSSVITLMENKDKNKAEKAYDIYYNQLSNHEIKYLYCISKKICFQIDYEEGM